MARRQGCEILKLMKPGPAISTLETCCGLAEIGDQRLGQLARLHAGGLGQQQGDVGGVVAVLARAGALDHVVGRGQVLGQAILAAQVEQGLGHEFAQMLFHGAGFMGTSRAL